MYEDNVGVVDIFLSLIEDLGNFACIPKLWFCYLYFLERFMTRIHWPFAISCWWHTVNFSHCWFWLFRNLNHFYLVLVNIPTDQYLLKKKTIRRERTRLHWPITDYRYLVRISVGKVRNWGYLIKGTMVADKDVELRNLRTMVLLFQFLGEVEDI